MVKSKVGKKEFEFDEENWVVSLINTGGFIKNGPHAKIIVEGLNNDEEWLSNEQDNPQHKALFVAEYHIMESNCMQGDNAWARYLPPALVNIKGKACVLILERSRYGANKQGRKDKLEQYETCISSQWRVPHEKVREMRNNIKEEKTNFDDKGNYKAFQYAGSMRLFSRGQGHNCITWCMEKLEIAGIELSEHFLDSIKAVPEKHIRDASRNYNENVEEIGESFVCKIL